MKVFAADIGKKLFREIEKSVIPIGQVTVKKHASLGKGNFASVCKGIYQGKEVAVKVIKTKKGNIITTLSWRQTEMKNHFAVSVNLCDIHY